MMTLSPVAKTMLYALQAAWPEALTIEPKDATDAAALDQLRDAGYVEIYDTWSNGDRRWTASKLGRMHGLEPTVS